MDAANAAVNVDDIVVLNVPDNPRLHNRTGRVAEVTAYGARVRTGVGGGEFRALLSELRPGIPGPDAKAQGYSGDVCANCQGSRLRRNGACLCCDDCGTTTGCS